MAKTTTPEKKERRPARTIDERIAELRELEAKRQARREAKADAELTKLEDVILKLETKLGNAITKRDEYLVVLGRDPEFAPADEPVAAE